MYFCGKSWLIGLIRRIRLIRGQEGPRAFCWAWHLRALVGCFLVLRRLLAAQEPILSFFFGCFLSWKFSKSRQGPFKRTFFGSWSRLEGKMATCQNRRMYRGFGLFSPLGPLQDRPRADPEHFIWAVFCLGTLLRPEKSRSRAFFFGPGGPQERSKRPPRANIYIQP